MNKMLIFFTTKCISSMNRSNTLMSDECVHRKIVDCGSETMDKSCSYGKICFVEDSSVVCSDVGDRCISSDNVYADMHGEKLVASEYENMITELENYLHAEKNLKKPDVGDSCAKCEETYVPMSDIEQPDYNNIGYHVSGCNSRLDSFNSNSSYDETKLLINYPSYESIISVDDANIEPGGNSENEDCKNTNLESQSWFVTKFKKKYSLKNLIKGKKELRVGQIIKQILLIVKWLYENNLYHGKLNVKNIYIYNDEVKIGGFMNRCSCYGSFCGFLVLRHSSSIEYDMVAIRDVIKMLVEKYKDQGVMHIKEDFLKMLEHNILDFEKLLSHRIFEYL